MKYLKLFAAFIPSAVCVSQAAYAGEKRKPNIVIILADDLISSELSYLGGKNIKTPNIDRIAEEGCHFSRMYASEAMSVPIRASLYTGLYPARHGSYQNHKHTYANTLTVNEYLANENYRVGRTGKNHPVTTDVYRFETIPGFVSNCLAKESPYSTEGIKKWISDCKETPFALFVCSIHPHFPWTCGNPAEFAADSIIMPEYLIDTPKTREIMCRYLAEVRELDNQVGAVMAALKETGHEDDTIVFFLGEQGAQMPGGKWTLWEPGVNSAMAVRYPAVIPAGSHSDILVQYEDILPTLIDLAGGKKAKELDGISFKRTLMHPEKQNKRKYAYGIHNNWPSGKPYPIRSIRDKRYTLIVNLSSDSLFYSKALMAPKATNGLWKEWNRAAKTDSRNKFLCDRFTQRPAIEFYDRENDPLEMNNLAEDPQYRARISRMMKRLSEWMKGQNDSGAAMDIPYINDPGRSPKK